MEENKNTMSDSEIDEVVKMEQETSVDEELTDLRLTVDRLTGENQELREANANISKERDNLTKKVNELQDLVTSQASQLQIKNQENNKNIITIDALQEKLLNMIRSINNK